MLIHALMSISSGTGVPFIRSLRTAAGARAVQIAEYVRGHQQIVKQCTSGSAYTEAELGMLPSASGELLDNLTQGVFELGIEPTPPVEGLIVASGPALFEATGAQ